MALGTELTMQGFFRSQPAPHGPSSNILQLHWKHCRRVFLRTHIGILPPTEDELFGPSRFSQFGFRFRRLSEFRRQIWISLARLNFSAPACHFLFHKITSFTIDFATEHPTRICPSMIIIADINFVQKLCVDYISRPLEFIQPSQLGAAAFMDETFVLRTSGEGRHGAEVDSNAFVDETTFIMGRTTEDWGGAEVDNNTFLDETFILGISAEADKNAGIEMIRRRRRREKWVMGGGEEANCSICLEGFSEGEEVMRMECEHIYHEECILTWLKQKQKQTCPLCRRQI